MTDIKSDVFNQKSLPGTPKSVPNLAKSGGALRRATGTIANGAGDPTGSIYRLKQLHPRVILTPDTLINFAAWGFANARLGVIDGSSTVVGGGVAGAEAGLMAETAVSGLSNPVALVTAFDARWGKELWEQAGLSEAPANGAMLDIAIVTTAAATGAGLCQFDIVWQAEN